MHISIHVPIVLHAIAKLDCHWATYEICILYPYAWWLLAKAHVKIRIAFVLNLGKTIELLIVGVVHIFVE